MLTWLPKILRSFRLRAQRKPHGFQADALDEVRSEVQSTNLQASPATIAVPPLGEKVELPLRRPKSRVRTPTEPQGECVVPHGGLRSFVLDQRLKDCAGNLDKVSPHGVGPLAKAPHGGQSQSERDQLALDRFTRIWSDSVAAPARRTRWQAKELAQEFHRHLQAQPDLVGVWLHCNWVESHYPLFCNWLGVAGPPPYKDFARELALIMPRRRKDTRQGGIRRTYRAYFVSSRPRP